MKKLSIILFIFIYTSVSFAQNINYINLGNESDPKAVQSDGPKRAANTEIESEVFLGFYDTNGIGGYEQVFSQGNKIIIKETEPKIVTRNYSFNEGWELLEIVETSDLGGIEIVVRNTNSINIIHDYTRENRKFQFQAIDSAFIVDTDDIGGKEVVVIETKGNVNVIHDTDSSINNYPMLAESVHNLLGVYELDNLPGMELLFADTISKKVIDGKMQMIGSLLMIINDGKNESYDYQFGRGDVYTETWNIEGVGNLNPEGASIVVISWKQSDYVGSSFTGNYRGGYRLISLSPPQQKKILVYSHMLEIDPKDFTMETSPISSGSEVFFSLTAIPFGTTNPVTTQGSIKW
jgi:hypothetical protein